MKEKPPFELLLERTQPLNSTSSLSSSSLPNASFTDVFITWLTPQKIKILPGFYPKLTVFEIGSADPILRFFDLNFSQISKFHIRVEWAVLLDVVDISLNIGFLVINEFGNRVTKAIVLDPVCAVGGAG